MTRKSLVSDSPLVNQEVEEAREAEENVDGGFEKRLIDAFAAFRPSDGGSGQLEGMNL